MRDYQGATDQEKRDVARIRAMLATAADPWSRANPLHLTGSALVVHPATARVLLRWHRRIGAWLQVGGHADPGETDGLTVALREAAEETGLTDLVPWPNGELVHVTIVPVPAGKGEPAHEHADLRYVLATEHPDQARAEQPLAPVRWLTIDQALGMAGEDGIAETLRRVAALLR
jgi:8-oxo-dGTP pyrophosphatase MutT (NUDIX family)